MKFYIHTIILALLVGQLKSFAQDIIYLRNGEEIKSKVQEIGVSEIKYFKTDSAYTENSIFSGPVYVLQKASVLLIRYQNGKKDTFDTNPDAVVITTNIPSTLATTKAEEAIEPQVAYEKGVADAAIFYRGQGSGRGGIVVAALVFPPIGLIPTIPISITPPQVHNLGLPNVELYRQNPDYARGYMTQAKKTKTRKAWTNFAIGSGIYLVLLLISVSAN